MFEIEDSLQAKGYRYIVGIDEAGRGPLAGPVVASAVLLKNKKFTSRIADSKKMSPSRRDEAFHEIYENAYVGVGIMNETIIDEINILQATFQAMNNAVESLCAQVKEERIRAELYLLIDGNQFVKDSPYSYLTVVDGDAKVFSIACASIIAKVTRDRILNMYDRIFPEYGFRSHKGYPTVSHKQAIRKHGLCLIHRRSFHYI